MHRPLGAAAPHAGISRQNNNGPVPIGRRAKRVTPTNGSLNSCFPLDNEKDHAPSYWLAAAGGEPSSLATLTPQRLSAPIGQAAERGLDWQVSQACQERGFFWKRSRGAWSPQRPPTPGDLPTQLPPPHPPASSIPSGAAGALQPPARYLSIATRLRGAAALLRRGGAEEGVQRLLPDHGGGERRRQRSGRGTALRGGSGATRAGAQDADLAPKARACAEGGAWRREGAHAPPRRTRTASLSASAGGFPLQFPPRLAAGRRRSPLSVPPMDRYVVKRPAGEAGGGGGKRPRPEEPASGEPAWQEIRAEGLNCDYRLLFGRAEADEIFQQLEEEVEYFEGNRTQLRLPRMSLCPGRCCRPTQGSPRVMPVAWAELPDVQSFLQALGVCNIWPCEVKCSRRSDLAALVWFSLKRVSGGFIHVLMFPKNRGSLGRVTGLLVDVTCERDIPGHINTMTE